MPPKSSRKRGNSDQEAGNAGAATKRARPKRNDALDKLSADVESLSATVQSHAATIGSLGALPELVKSLSEKIDASYGVSQDFNDAECDQNDEESFSDANENGVASPHLLKILNMGEPAAEYGEAFSPCVAKSFANLTAHEADKEKMEAWRKKYKAPENCKLLTAPKVNPLIWNQLPNKCRQRDFSLQQMQLNVSLATVAIGKAVEEILAGNASEDSILSFLMESANILGCTSRDISMKRRMDIKQSINPEFSSICSGNLPVTEFLFGDNVEEALKTAKAASTMMKSIKPTGTNRLFSRGSSNTRLNFRRPFQHGRGRPMFRGAPRRPMFRQSAFNKPNPSQQ